MAAAAAATNGQWLLAARWRVEEEAGKFSSPTVARGGSGSGRCVSAHTRERSEQPLPLHPAIRLRRMCWVAAASGPAWQSYWLLLLLLLPLLPLAKKAKPAAGQAGKQKLFAAVIGHWPLVAAAAAAAIG